MVRLSLHRPRDGQRVGDVQDVESTIDRLAVQRRRERDRVRRADRRVGAIDGFAQREVARRVIAVINVVGVIHDHHRQRNGDEDRVHLAGERRERSRVGVVHLAALHVECVGAVVGVIPRTAGRREDVLDRDRLGAVAAGRHRRTGRRGRGHAVSGAAQSHVIDVDRAGIDADRARVGDAGLVGGIDRRHVGQCAGVCGDRVDPFERADIDGGLQQPRITERRVGRSAALAEGWSRC